jgi:hypothetical protein
MKRLLLISFGSVINLSLIAASASAAGISVDAGLTPAEDRWIFRTQVRYMRRTDDPTGMDRKIPMPFQLFWHMEYGLT